MMSSSFFSTCSSEILILARRSMRSMRARVVLSVAKTIADEASSVSINSINMEMNRLSLFDQQWTKLPIRVRVTVRRPPLLTAAASIALKCGFGGRRDMGFPIRHGDDSGGEDRMRAG